MARRRLEGLERVLGVNALFSTAYGNVGSSIYYALGLVASLALGLTPVVFLITGIFFLCTAATYAEATAMYPEAGGSSSFARRAFNEFWSFFAAWGQMLNYVVTVAISAFFVPHYLGSVFWAPLRHSPADIIAGALIIAILAVINVIGAKESAGLNIGLAVVDFLTQVLLVVVGIVLVLGANPGQLADNVVLGVAPTWKDFVLAIPIGMIAYTGIETISNMAEEAKDEVKTIPAALKGLLPRNPDRNARLKGDGDDLEHGGGGKGRVQDDPRRDQARGDRGLRHLLHAAGGGARRAARHPGRRRHLLHQARPAR